MTYANNFITAVNDNKNIRIESRLRFTIYCQHIVIIVNTLNHKFIRTLRPFYTFLAIRNGIRSHGPLNIFIFTRRFSKSEFCNPFKHIRIDAQADHTILDISDFRVKKFEVKKKRKKTVENYGRMHTVHTCWVATIVMSVQYITSTK